jgi:hypothetical protein
MQLLTSRVGQNRIYTLYMTVYLVISLPKIPYMHRIFMVLANPTHKQCHHCSAPNKRKSGQTHARPLLLGGASPSRKKHVWAELTRGKGSILHTRGRAHKVGRGHTAMQLGYHRHPPAPPARSLKRWLIYHCCLLSLLHNIIAFSMLHNKWLTYHLCLQHVA